MPRRQPEYPVYLTISEMLSVETLLRKQIEHLDTQIRNKRAMSEQRSAIRDRIRYFDKINTKMFTSRGKIDTMSDDEKALLELIRRNEMKKAIGVISKIYNLDSGDLLQEIQHNSNLREVFSTEYGLQVELSSQNKEVDKLSGYEKLLFDWLKANNQGDAITAISNLNDFGNKKWFSQLNQNPELQQAYDTIRSDKSEFNRLISLFLLTEGQNDSERKIIVL